MVSERGIWEPIPNSYGIYIEGEEIAFIEFRKWEAA